MSEKFSCFNCGEETENEPQALCDTCDEESRFHVASLESQLSAKDAALAEALEALERVHRRFFRRGVCLADFEILDYVDALLAKLRPNKEGQP